MRLNEFVFLLTKTFNPGDYKMLVARKKRDAVQYFLLLLLFCLVIGFLLNIPNIITSHDYFDQQLSKFERFNISVVDIELKEPLILFEEPKIVVDFSENASIGDKAVLITRTEVMWKKPSPDIFQLRLFTTERKPVAEFSDVVSNIRALKFIYWAIFIAVLPSLFFVFYVFYLLKYTLIMLFVTLVGYFIVKLRNRRSGVIRTAKIAVFSSTILVTADVALSRLLNIGTISFLIYLAMFFVCLFAASEKDIKIKSSDEE